MAMNSGCNKLGAAKRLAMSGSATATTLVPLLLFLLFPSFSHNHFHRKKMNSGAGDQILRSTTHKDRHTKVFTAKGPRHRRVRLSALTAIRFYDLQDRLGYDRPSKAVDWLINNAKFVIDKLRNPDRKTGETEQSVFNSQLNLQSAAGKFESFFPATSATADVDFRGFPACLTRIPDDPVRDLALSLHNFRDSRVVLSEEDGKRSPSMNQRVIADSIPAGYGGSDAGLWLKQPLLREKSAAALDGRFDRSSEFRTPSQT